MKRIFISAFTVLGIFTYAQKTYTVKAKDNPYSISKAHGITLDQFYELNPKARTQTLDIGEVVFVSKTGSNTSTAVDQNAATGEIKIHQGQTLYSISKAYHVSIDDIKKLNPELGDGLQIDQHLKLPLGNIKKYGGDVVEIPSEKPATSVSVEAGETYIVQPKDTYYKITKKYNTSQKALFQLNPWLEARGLQPGDKIIVSGTPSHVTTEVVAQNQPIEKNTTPEVSQPTQGDGTYVVQEGDTVFGILNKFGISLDQLLELNPQLEQGLKIGQILKVKGGNTSTYIKSTGDALNVVLLLPFGLDTGDSKYQSTALDFLTGAKLAIEKSVAKGLKVHVNIVDEGNEATFKKALNGINKDNTDLIIGPFFKSDVVELMSYVSSKKIPVVSPFANSKDLYQYPNLIITETDYSAYADKIANEVIAAHKGEKIYIIGDSSSYAGEIKSKIEKAHKNASIVLVNNVDSVSLDQNMMTGQKSPVIVVLASDTPSVKSAFVQKMAALTDEVTGNKAFSMFYSSEFDNKENMLRKAGLVYLMDRKINTDGTFEKEVLKEYNDKYCKSPSKYAVAGFDIVYDALSRENEKGQIFKNIKKEQTHLATKFDFEKTKEGAYVNQGFRVVRLVP
ncbi:LysM peptidoglycan-binding domain-containing protein [Elizabethkingia sp. JS20170427COW]|uniref:LysM peptidoglycan-binding domain-containing protein n=1 Tax=Elizabethkingia sp. JS20170427COW TaxID=2583851 RepID=UPI0011101FD1|nr:LysM peptidoglycan-binding domain-containing protein [Elizabethkingia sp. JS20170427COW]QCX52957.1 LysM peptidoglycan-binding domain-containing protein [Elizabethkingia sp. JS20170427COW]